MKSETNKEGVTVMARARSPNSIEAEKLYHDGMKLVDISKKLDVPEGTVRRWKSTQHWDNRVEENKGERSDKKMENKASVRKKGAPRRNQNAIKHGGYSSVYWDFLKDCEKDLEVSNDEEVLLLEQIRVFSIRERRLMLAINKYSSKELYMSGVSKYETKRKFKDANEEMVYNERIKEKVKKQDRLPGESIKITTNTGASIDLIARLERELTAVQGKKTKAIEALMKLRFEKQRLDDTKQGNEVVNDWISGVIGEDDE